MDNIDSTPQMPNSGFFNRGLIQEVGFWRWASRTFWRQFNKRVLAREQRFRLPTGLEMVLPRESHFASEIYVTGGESDWGSEALLFRLLNPAGAFLDVGANIGYYGLYMAPKAERVYCFEPDDRARAHLERNVQRHRRVTVVPSAVGRKSGQGWLEPGSVPDISRAQMSRSAGAGAVAVEFTSIDEFAQKIGLAVSGIKIDVEGLDLEVIEGARATIASDRPYILTEAPPTGDLFAVTNEINYAVFAIARERESRRRVFTQLTGSPPDELITKMLLLCPVERSEQVIAESRTLHLTRSDRVGPKVFAVAPA